MLRAQHAFVDRILARAERCFSALEEDPQALAALATDATRCLRFFEGRPAVFRCRPSLASALRGEVGGREGCVVEEVPGMPLGVRVAACDGSLEVDHTLPARITARRAELAVTILAAERGP